MQNIPQLSHKFSSSSTTTLKASKPLVSVILPTFNGEPFLSEAIQSVLDQTFENWELLVQDNASTDGTREVVSRYCDRRITYRRNSRNIGMAANLNAAIRRSAGEYLSLFSDDDRMLPNYLEKQLGHFKRYKHIGFTFCLSHRINEKGRRLCREEHLWDDQYAKTPALVVPKQGLLLLLNYGCLPGNISPIIIRKQCLENVGLFKNHYTMALDWDLCIRLAAKFGFAFLNERLIEIRNHSRQASGDIKKISLNMKESFECLDMLTREIMPYVSNSQPLMRKIEKGVKRKYGEAYFHNILRLVLSGDIRQAVLCGRIVRQRIGLFWPILHWLIYLPKRAKRRLACEGKGHMETVLCNHDVQKYFIK